MMKEFWNDRFAADEYIYGVQPNAFFASRLNQIKPGKLLLPGEGEGRNAVWATQVGWEVDAIDYSETAKAKALKLAELNQLRLNSYQIMDLNEFQISKSDYDAIGLVFVHLLPAERSQLHRKLARALKPGGSIILEAFSTDQLQYQSGGPRNPLMLYNADLLSEDFSSLEIVLLEQKVVILEEGEHHTGEAAVIRLMATKPVV